MTALKTNSDFRHRLPPDGRALSNKNKSLLKIWEELTPWARNEWICWMTLVKRVETRKEYLKHCRKTWKKIRSNRAVGPDIRTAEKALRNGLETVSSKVHLSTNTQI